MQEQHCGAAPVGSLIAIGEEIVAEGIESVRTRFDPAAPAEIEALRAACEKLQSLDLTSAALYTNIEPCVMCAFAMRQTGIATVVCGVSNKQVGGVNSKFAVWTAPNLPAKFPPPEIRTNILLE